MIDVVAELGGPFKVLDGKLDWTCSECLETVHDTGLGYYGCDCGWAFAVAIVSAFSSPNGPRLLVTPLLPPCSEPEPEA